MKIFLKIQKTALCLTALDVRSLNYFEAFEMLIPMKTFYKFSVKLKKIDILIQHYPEFQGIPTQMNPRMEDKFLLS